MYDCIFPLLQRSESLTTVCATPTFTFSERSGASASTPWSRGMRYVCRSPPLRDASAAEDLPITSSSYIRHAPAADMCCDVAHRHLFVQIVGVVEQLGSSVTHLKKGDTVGFGWFKNCCQHCDACITGNDVSCPC